MFNALNNLSEDSSLLTIPPWDNQWLLGAIATSMGLHFVILYVPWLAKIFGVARLSWAEWRAVLLLSFPVIPLDEAIKFVSRVRREAQAKAGHSGQGCDSLHSKRIT